MDSAACSQKIKALFCEGANHFTQLLNESLKIEKIAKNEGYKDGYNEIFEWAMMHSREGVKNVPIGELLEFIRIKKTDCDNLKFNMAKGVQAEIKMLDIEEKPKEAEKTQVVMENMIDTEVTYRKIVKRKEN